MLNATHGGRIPDDDSWVWGAPVLGIIGLTGDGVPCFFPDAESDGVPVGDAEALAAAVAGAEPRWVASERVEAMFDALKATRITGEAS